MERVIKGKILIRLIFILTLVLVFSKSSTKAVSLVSTALSASPDAVAFRVIPNPDYLSPLRWYQENIKVKGSPQALTVDGYEAVRDGRTVYVNAANVSCGDSCGNSGTLQVCGDNTQTTYFNGVNLPSVSGPFDQFPYSQNVAIQPGKNVIAIYVDDFMRLNNQGACCWGLSAILKRPGCSDVSTNDRALWKCTIDDPDPGLIKTLAWTRPDFDDSRWTAASYGNPINNIGPNIGTGNLLPYQTIWAAEKYGTYEASKVWCRRSFCAGGGNCASGACPTNLYTNIYIISYNQQAENETVDIFGQILEHWKFNTNITDPVIKAEVVRDTKRLADLADIKLALKNYQASHNGAYPELLAGSYLAGKSISVWPSWRATLGTALGVTLPIDPVNKLGVCDSDPEINKLYNSTTCWDQKNKKFADPSPPPDTNFNLPPNSHAYVYTIGANGTYNICALMESNYAVNLPDACPSGVGHTGSGGSQAITINCGALKGYVGQEFTGFVSATYSGSGALNWQIPNPNPPDVLPGITKQDTAVPKQKKLVAPAPLTAGSYSVGITVSNSSGSSASKVCPITIGGCGDGLINGAEQCDDGNTVGGDGCSNACVSETRVIACTTPIPAYTVWNNNPSISQIYDGTSWQPRNTSSYNTAVGDCHFKCITNYTWDINTSTCQGCGDGIVTAPEQCDGAVGVGPHQLCSATCRLMDTWCGDGIKQTPNQTGKDGPANDGNEACDGSSGIGPHQSCSANCTLNNLTWCGDGIKQTPNQTGKDGPQNDGNEACDGTDGIGAHQSCSATCTLNNLTWCGDGVVQSPNDYGVNEICDKGAASLTRKKNCSGPAAGVPAYCGAVTVQGTQDCNSTCTGWDSCSLNPIVSQTTTSCGSVNDIATNYACCELMNCSQDGCACCGYGEATITPGYINKMKMNASWDLIFPDKSSYWWCKDGTTCGADTPQPYAYGVPVCWGGYNYNSDNRSCNSCASKVGYASWQSKDSCKLNRGDDITVASTTWEITVNHSTATYQCWR